MRKILVISILALLFAGLKAQEQQSPINLRDLQVNNNPLVPVDPFTGQPSDTMPKLYHFSFSADDLTDVRFIYLTLGSSGSSKTDVLQLTAELNAESGSLIVKAGIFTEPVNEVPAEIRQTHPDIPKYMIQIPVELTDLQANAWNYAEVYIEDNYQRKSVAATLNKTR